MQSNSLVEVEKFLNKPLLSPVYTTLNFWYDTDKFGTRTTFLVLGLSKNQKSGTVPKIERSVNGALIDYKYIVN
jgi:hypothetical protein